MKLGDIEDLRAFVCIVEKRGISAAARSLEAPKSSVSRRLAALETRLKVRLLERTSRDIRLTESGLAVYQHAVRILDEVALIADAIGTGEPRGLLRVTSTYTLLDTVLRPLIKAFLGQYPSIDLEIEATAKLSDLVRDDFDVAVRAGALTGGSLIARRLARVQIGLFAAPDYLEACGLDASAPELARRDVLGLLSSEIGVRSDKSRLVARGRRPRLVLNDPLLLKGQILEGTGAAWLPTYIVSQELSEGRMVRCLPDQTIEGPEIFALYSGRHDLPLKTRTFIDFLAEKLDIQDHQQGVSNRT